MRLLVVLYVMFSVRSAPMWARDSYKIRFMAQTGSKPAGPEPGPGQVGLLVGHRGVEGGSGHPACEAPTFPF